MKILIASDLHGRAKTLEYLEAIIKKNRPEALIVPGDVTDRDDVGFLDRLFGLVSKHKLESFIVWGNSDGGEAQRAIDLSVNSSHLRLRKLGKFMVYGISEVDEAIVPDSKAIAGSILITHRPPSLSSLNRKLDNAPLFHINGHIHSRGYLKKYISTTHLQVPSLQLGKYVIFDPERVTAQFLSI
jgi:Icc-related predicted phosphoesterase